ncbi:MAG TPA: hypothetical protein VFM25_04285 [Verrucomicrobiae bacterium]|nr:hypothetical protein [Verrucomicrobiae bacterium]
MALTEKQKSVLNLLRIEFERERTNNFSQLRLIPSTHVRQFVDYFSSLKELDKDALAGALSEHALARFFPSEVQNAHQNGNVAFKKYREAMVQMWDWKYVPIRELRLLLGVAKLEPESRTAALVTDDIRRWIEAIKPVKSAEIRRVVKLGLDQIISSLEIKHPIEDWIYEGELRGKMVSIAVNYSHRFYQLEYGVKIQNQERGKFWFGLNYEQIMGLSFSHWDLLEQANLDQSVALLKEHIIYCTNFLEQLHDY